MTGTSLAVNMGEKNKTYVSPDTPHQCCGSGSVCVLGLLDTDPDPLVRDTDPAPDPSIIKQKK
jgi:hypothetical protein